MTEKMLKERAQMSRTMVSYGLLKTVEGLQLADDCIDEDMEKRIVEILDKTIDLLKNQITTESIINKKLYNK